MPKVDVSRTRYARLIAPGSRHLGAPYCACRGGAVEYRVTYKILPAGVGPDDYESADLEERVDIVDLPQPADPTYGPAIPEVQTALRDMLDMDAHPVITKFEKV